MGEMRARAALGSQIPNFPCARHFSVGLNHLELNLIKGFVIFLPIRHFSIGLQHLELPQIKNFGFFPCARHFSMGLHLPGLSVFQDFVPEFPRTKGNPLENSKFPINPLNPPLTASPGGVSGEIPYGKSQISPGKEWILQSNPTENEGKKIPLFLNFQCWRLILEHF